MEIGNYRDPVNPSAPARRGNTLLVFGWAHEFHVAGIERHRQFVEAHDRRVALPLLEAAYVMLTARTCSPRLLNNRSGSTRSAPACRSMRAAKAASISSSAAAFRLGSCAPFVRAAS